MNTQPLRSHRHNRLQEQTSNWALRQSAPTLPRSRGQRQRLTTSSGCLRQGRPGGPSSPPQNPAAQASLCRVLRVRRQWRKTGCPHQTPGATWSWPTPRSPASGSPDSRRLAQTRTAATPSSSQAPRLTPQSLRRGKALEKTNPNRGNQVQSPKQFRSQTLSILRAY